MTKNNLLNTAIIICKGIQGLLILVFGILTLLFIHIQIDKEFYQDKIVTVEKSSISYSNSRDIDDPATKNLTLDEMSTGSLYVTYVRFSILLLIVFLSIGEFKKIMISVQNRHTFQNNNVKSFRKIGTYCIIYFFVSSFYFYQFKEADFTGMSVSFTPALFALFAFIMAEIFKEGNSLLEDKELTI